MTGLAQHAPLLLGRQQARNHVPTDTAGFVISLLYIRWLAGVAENFGAPAISEFAALLLLTGLGILLLGRMCINAATSMLFLGLFAWIFTGVLSLAANSVDAPIAAIALLTLLLLYALIADTCFSHLVPARSLTSIGIFLSSFVVLGAALAVFQIGTGTGFVEVGKISIQRAIGSDVHPVSFAIQIVAALTALECIRVKRRKRLNIIYVGVALLGLIALYLTYARTAWVMALMIIAYAVLANGNWLTRLICIVTAVPITVYFLITSDRFADLASLSFFWSNFSLDNLVFDYRYIDNSISWRIVNWGYGFQQAMEQPLLGFGPGQSATSSYFSLEMHNILLETFFEGGIFGTGAFLICLAGLFRMHRRMPDSTAPDRTCKNLANGFGFSLLLAVLLSTSFVDQLMSFILYMLLLTVASIPSTQKPG